MLLNEGTLDSWISEDFPFLHSHFGLGYTQSGL